MVASNRPGDRLERLKVGMELLQELKDPTKVTREVGYDLTGTVLNLGAGFKSKTTNCKTVFNAGIKPDTNSKS